MILKSSQRLPEDGPPLLHDFLLKNRGEILSITERKTLELAGTRSSSEQLKQGLPIFFNQLLGILLLRREAVTKPAADLAAAARSAGESDEPGMARAADRPQEVDLAISAGSHGTELLRLGYTLSHVVHAYGAMCQAITEFATLKNFPISTNEFHDLNQCLDVAIAGAVTQYQRLRDSQSSDREAKSLGFLAHEMRNALTSANVSFELIRRGVVGVSGSTGLVMEKSLRRIEELIDQALAEVRLHMDPEVRLEPSYLLQIVDEILITAEVEADSRKQRLEVHIDPSLVIQVDPQTFHSALSNLIQNAIKYTRVGGRIEVRASVVGEQTIIEIEDECGGLLTDRARDLFEPFVQKNENRKGLGLGLSIAQRAIALHQGTIEAHNLPQKGCVFKITLPNKSPNNLTAVPAA